jgi:hypothetical protein
LWSLHQFFSVSNFGGTEFLRKNWRHGVGFISPPSPTLCTRLVSEFRGRRKEKALAEDRIASCLHGQCMSRRNGAKTKTCLHGQCMSRRSPTTWANPAAKPIFLTHEVIEFKPTF